MSRRSVGPRSPIGPARPCPPVAIQKCASYEGKELRQRLDRALELIGGIKDLVGGKTVTMKINVTGGPGSLCGLPGFRTYQVHPNLVAAMCAALHDAGARRIVLVESQYSLKSPRRSFTTAAGTSAPSGRPAGRR